MKSGPELHDLVGDESVLCIFTSYFLRVNKIEPTKLTFSGLKVPGSELFLSPLMVEFNLSSFIIKSACLAISVFYIAKKFFKTDAA